MQPLVRKLNLGTQRMRESPKHDLLTNQFIVIRGGAVRMGGTLRDGPAAIETQVRFVLA